MLTENGLTTCRMCGWADILTDGCCFDCTVENVQDWEYDADDRYAILHDEWN